MRARATAAAVAGLATGAAVLAFWRVVILARLGPALLLAAASAALAAALALRRPSAPRVVALVVGLVAVNVVVLFALAIAGGR